LLKAQDKVKWTALLYSNVYGPRQDPHGEAGVIAIFCQKLINNEAPLIFGEGVCIRDYVYCLDVARANVIAIDKANKEMINIGTNKGSDVNKLFNVIKDSTGYLGEATPAPFREGDVLVNILNINKAKEVLDWKPEINLEEGLKKTVEFFKN
jgi:UDP-glucose 4-epimerase